MHTKERRRVRRTCMLRTNTFQSFKHFHTLADKKFFLNNVFAIELGRCR